MRNSCMKSTPAPTRIILVASRSRCFGTTRPELLAACVALFINPEDERYNNLIGKEAIVPIYNFLVPILGDTKVIKEKSDNNIKYIDREVVKYDNTCVLPKEFIKAHNEAAQAPK